jgi:hypothetical protein
MIDATTLDWSKWQVVFVSVSYEENEYLVRKNIRLDKSTPLQNFDVLSFSAQGKPFKYAIQYARAGSETVKVNEKENANDFLILEEPADASAPNN